LCGSHLICRPHEPVIAACGTIPDREKVPRAPPNVDAQPCGRRSTGAMIAFGRQARHVDTGFANGR
jgi:hypothetical protein